MIREYKLNTAGQLDLGWRDVEFWLSIFHNLTQADLDNPRLFTPNLESVVEPQNKKSMEKIYVLQRQFDNIKAGTNFKFDGKDTYHLWATYVGETESYSVCSLPKEFVENNPDWFLPKKEQEWEIQSFINATNDVVLTRFPDGLYRWKQQHSGDTSEALLAMPHMKIYSVKRLSDGQTFSVGAENCCAGKSYQNPPYPNKPIKKFFFEGEVLMCQFYEGHGNNDGCVSIHSIEKAPQQPPQEEQKDNDVFQWTDKTVTEFVKSLNEKQKEAFNRYPQSFLDTFKKPAKVVHSDKKYTEEQLLQARREAFEAGRKGKSTTWEANGSGNQTGVHGLIHPNFDSYLQSLNNK